MASKLKQMDKFFRPKTVAIIGASTKARKVGHVIFRNFAEGPFKGKVIPINHNAEKLFGEKCYKSVLDVKEKIDLAVIAIPAKFVPQAIDECGKKGISATIIITSGFRETGNIELEKVVAAKLKHYNIRAVGVNCLGIFDPYSGVDTLFLPSYKLERPEKGNIAFGFEMAKELARLDIGQTVVVKEKAVVAVEAMEGTDETIRRAGRIVGSTPGGLTVVKVARPSQDMRFDVPVVGPRTIDTMSETGASALGLEAGKSILLEREELLRRADEVGICICGISNEQQ